MYPLIDLKKGMLLFLIPVLVLSNEQSQGTEGIPAVCDTQTKKDMDIKSEEGPKCNEWIQKALAEAMADKDKQDTIVVPTPKQRPKKNYASKRPKKNYASNRPKKNYASAECVARILAFNPESTNPKGLLNSNKDDYMLNPCKVKKWVVIELCEPIQAHSIAIASLELFSSQPKLFKIYLSDRYPPTKNWKFALETSLKDERVVQSFDLLTESHDYFAKFVKIELVDHFGDEHFCPLTILKVFGIAVTDYEDLNQEGPEQGNMDDDHVLCGAKEEKNLFYTAREPQKADSQDSQNTDSVQINPCPTSPVFDSDIQESCKPDTKDVLETDTESESETFIQADDKFTKVTDRQMSAILIGILIFIIMSRWERKESLSPEVKKLSGPATQLKKDTRVMDLGGTPNKFPSKTLLGINRNKVGTQETGVNYHITQERHQGSAALSDLQIMQIQNKIHEIEMDSMKRLLEVSRLGNSSELQDKIHKIEMFTMNRLLEKLTERVYRLENSLKQQKKIHKIEMDFMKRKLEVSRLGNSSELQNEFHEIEMDSMKWKLEVFRLGNSSELQSLHDFKQPFFTPKLRSRTFNPFPQTINLQQSISKAS